jgi:hypothetical protein
LGLEYTATWAAWQSSPSWRPTPGKNELALFGLRQAEKMIEALKRLYYGLFEKHISRQSA